MLYPSAIRRRVQRALESGTPSSLHPENLSSIDDLFRQADRGDAAARQETDRIAGLFASLLCNAQIMMDPQDILFHDAYGYSCEYFHRRMEEICREKTDGSFFAPPRIGRKRGFHVCCKGYASISLSWSVNHGKLYQLRHAFLQRRHDELEYRYRGDP